VALGANPHLDARGTLIGPPDDHPEWFRPEVQRSHPVYQRRPERARNAGPGTGLGAPRYDGGMSALDPMSAASVRGEIVA
jgi:hypothetical protein